MKRHRQSNMKDCKLKGRAKCSGLQRRAREEEMVKNGVKKEKNGEKMALGIG